MVIYWATNERSGKTIVSKGSLGYSSASNKFIQTTPYCTSLVVDSASCISFNKKRPTQFIFPKPFKRLQFKSDSQTNIFIRSLISRTSTLSSSLLHNDETKDLPSTVESHVGFTEFQENDVTSSTISKKNSIDILNSLLKDVQSRYPLFLVYVMNN